VNSFNLNNTTEDSQDTLDILKNRDQSSNTKIKTLVDNNTIR